MGIGKITDVDVVPDTGTVRSRPVVAVHQDLGALADRCLQHQRDQVSLGAVPFPESAIGPGHVEVPQARCGQAVGPGVGGDRVVDRQFACAISIRRTGRRIFGDRHRLGLAVGGRGRREHQSRSSGLQNRLEQIQRLDHIAVPVQLGILDRLTDQRLRREMQHTVIPATWQHPPGRDGHVGFHELRAIGHRIGVTGRQIVDDHDPMSLLQKHFRADTADVAGTAGHEQLHAKAACSMTFTSTRTPTANARSSRSKFGWCRSRCGPIPLHTPSRAIAPGTSSRYQEKSSPPPD